MSTRDIKKFIRAAEYLTVAQIFLQDNFLLERPLDFADVKPRLLGHFGTCPGIVKAYAHLSAAIKKTGQEMIFVLGPGHGYPGLQAALFLEKSLVKVDPKATLDAAGIAYICKEFSWPAGYPSHSSPHTPGAILEGGELGYSLSTAYGAVLDNPDLVAACLIGDGEAETASLMSALNLNKLVSPKSNGVVLPILHLNGYKISGPTIFGRMSDAEIEETLHGLGYKPIFVEERAGADFDIDMQTALARALKDIAKIKASEADGWFRTPFIVMRTAKGEGGPKTLDGQKIAGNALSHQVILTDAAHDKRQLNMLERWLESYKFGELFDEKTGFGEFVENVLPEAKLRMGNSLYANYGWAELKLPKLTGDPQFTPGNKVSKAMNSVGAYLRDAMKKNPRDLRFFCPDETASNKLDAVYEAGERAWLRTAKPWDEHMDPAGRTLELLSENTLQGVMEGYILTGRASVLSSYESFMPVVTSMVNQYEKFLEQSKSIKWRRPVNAMNFVLTSTGWRQDHNGFSHQNPGFISDRLLRPTELNNVLLPADDNSALVAMEFGLAQIDCINTIVAGKTPEPRWLKLDQARMQLEQGGAMVLSYASDKKPDVIVAAAGDYVNTEALYATQIVRGALPQIKMRFVNIAALSYGAIGTTKSKLTQERFDEIFTKSKPIVFSFHGYPATIKQILWNYGVGQKRAAHIAGYHERGSTTTPFDMQVQNQTDRYSIALQICARAAEQGIITGKELGDQTVLYHEMMRRHRRYIKIHGDDLPAVKDFTWTTKIDD